MDTKRGKDLVRLRREKRSPNEDMAHVLRVGLIVFALLLVILPVVFGEYANV